MEGMTMPTDINSQNKPSEEPPEPNDDPDGGYGPVFGNFGPQLNWPSQEEQDRFWEWYAEAMDIPDDDKPWCESPIAIAAIVALLTVDSIRTAVCEVYCKNRHALESGYVEVATIIGDTVLHHAGVPLPPLAIGQYILRRGILERLCICNG